MHAGGSMLLRAGARWQFSDRWMAKIRVFACHGIVWAWDICFCSALVPQNKAVYRPLQKKRAAFYMRAGANKSPRSDCAHVKACMVKPDGPASENSVTE